MESSLHLQDLLPAEAGSFMLSFPEDLVAGILDAFESLGSTAIVSLGSSHRNISCPGDGPELLRHYSSHRTGIQILIVLASFLVANPGASPPAPPMTWRLLIHWSASYEGSCQSRDQALVNRNPPCRELLKSQRCVWRK